MVEVRSSGRPVVRSSRQQPWSWRQRGAGGHEDNLFALGWSTASTTTARSRLDTGFYLGDGVGDWNPDLVGGIAVAQGDLAVG